MLDDILLDSARFVRLADKFLIVLTSAIPRFDVAARSRGERTKLAPQRTCRHARRGGRELFKVSRFLFFPASKQVISTVCPRRES